MAVLRQDHVRHQGNTHAVDTTAGTKRHVAMIRWALKDDLAGEFDYCHRMISPEGFDQFRFFFTDPDAALAFRMRWT